MKYYEGIAVDAGGNVFVIGQSNQQPQKYVVEIPKGLSCRLLSHVVPNGVSGIAVNHAGDLILATSAQNAVIYPPPYTSSSMTISLPGSSGPFEIALNKGGTALWVVAPYGKVMEYRYPQGGSPLLTIYDNNGASWGIAIAPRATP
jgi:DNA-binding beta-propeller fold protein YncE